MEDENNIIKIFHIPIPGKGKVVIHFPENIKQTELEMINNVVCDYIKHAQKYSEKQAKKNLQKIFKSLWQMIDRVDAKKFYNAL